MNYSSQPDQTSDDTQRARALLSAMEDLQAERQHLAEEVEQRKRAEAALRASEQQFRGMFQLAAVGMVQLDARTGRFLEVNPRYCQMTGYSLEELRELTPLDLDHPDDRARDMELLQKLLRQEIPEYLNVKRYVRKDGRVIWVMINGSLIADASGEPVRTIAVVHDVTDRVRAEAELQDSLKRERARGCQLRGLAEAALAITGNRPVDEILQDVTHRARKLIGAHQAISSFTLDRNWSQAITGLSLSDKYAEFRNYDEPPDGSGIYTMVCETNRPARMTQSALEAHPRWRGFGEEAARHPPMRGWLAAPLIGQDGKNLGLIQLSDKHEGDFTEEDEAVLVQLAQLTSIAIEVRRAHENLEQRIEERTQQLTRANEELRAAQQELAKTASQLALPVRAGELEDHSYELEKFSLTDMMDCGAVIRGLGSRPSKRQFADALVRHFYDRVVDADGHRALALVRLFETRRYAELDKDRQGIARETLPEIAADTRCLTLLATAGDEPAWNDVRRSQAHRVIPLPSREAVERLPMVAQLIRQLGLEVGGVLQPDPNILVGASETGVFHVERAQESGYIPAQSRFVVRYGIRSVVGFGDLLPDGRLFAVILFSKVPISRETALLFGHLALSTRMALLAHVEVPDKTAAQILALDRLLRNHERVVAEQEERVQSSLARLAASNAELEQFAYIASHDLQEPLRKIQAFGDLLATGYRDRLEEEGQDYLQRMQQAARRMRNLIEDLLCLSRIVRTSQPFERVDLNEVVQAVLVDLEARLAADGGRVDVGELPTLYADPTQMRQLFQNLIGNGLKYQRPDVPPVVTVKARRACAARGRRRIEEALWQITVGDNGIGFDPGDGERIFQPFQRLHGRSEYEGTGMGLTICRRIVERHGGTIEAEGRPGIGARFKVLLPARQAPGDRNDE